MKKKPSLQEVIKRAKKYHYQQSVSTLDSLTSQDVSITTQSSTMSSNKVIELVQKIFLFLYFQRNFLK